MLIVRPTEKTEIFRRIFPSFRKRDDVVEFQSMLVAADPARLWIDIPAALLFVSLPDGVSDSCGDVA